MNKNNQKVAVVFGITGQDGSYLSELLLSKGYEVIGVKRRASGCNTERLVEHPNLKLVEGDLTDSASINEIISHYAPDECYNLGAQSHVGTSFHQPLYTFEVDAKGPLLILEAIRHYSPHTKYYQASTSEMFGANCSIETKGTFVGMEPEADCFGYINRSQEKIQNEDTGFAPNSPYSIAKTAAHHLVQSYRKGYGLFACSGILFNHESERRGEMFVTRKISKYIGELQKWRNGLSLEYLVVHKDKITIAGTIIPGYPGTEFPKLKLGNIDTVRDWGHARDYVEAMWLMLQQDKPDDYIVGTGVGHSVKDFLIEAFALVGLNWQDWVEIDPSLYRPNEVPHLRCDWSKAKRVLGWTPKTDFKTLVKLMVEADIELAKLQRP